MWITRLGAVCVVAFLLAGCSDDDSTTSRESPTQDLSSTAEGIEAALQVFDEDAQEYPRTMRLRPGSVKVTGADRSNDTGDPRIRKGVRLDWYVGFPDSRRPTGPAAHLVTGYSYCLSEADRHWYVTSDEMGTTVLGARKGACPSKATPSRATSKLLDAARVAVQSSLQEYRADDGRYPRSMELAPGTGEQGELVLEREVPKGVAVGWYDDLALRKDPIATGRTSRADLIPQPDAKHGVEYSFCLDNGSEWRIVVNDRDGILDAEGDGACPPLGY